MRTYRIYFVGVVLIVAVALGGCSSSKEGSGRAVKLNDSDLIFIDSMVVHQQRAIEMARQAEQEVKRPEVKELARHIAAEQSQENEQLNAWREKWYQGKPVETHIHGADIHHRSPTPGNLSGDPDINFIEQMTRHHRETIRISQQALADAARPEIKQFAQSIISEQQGEVEKMEQWRIAWQQK